MAEQGLKILLRTQVPYMTATDVNSCYFDYDCRCLWVSDVKLVYSIGNLSGVGWKRGE